MKDQKTTTKTKTQVLNLPNKDDKGVPYMSYSQKTSWEAKEGFSTKLLGRKEYMLHYFFNVDFPDVGWAEFGHKVGKALEDNDFSNFTEEEANTLSKVTRLDLFEKKVVINFDEQGFYLYGFIDTCTSDLSYIKDYKTASEKSKSKYEKSDYDQLDIYALGVFQETGKYPEKMDVEVISRTGNAFKGGSSVLGVGKDIWIIEKKIDKQRLEEVKQQVLNTASEISDYYTVFQRLNK